MGIPSDMSDLRLYIAADQKKDEKTLHFKKAVTYPVLSRQAASGLLFLPSAAPKPTLNFPVVDTAS
jgi:hypothetical protein